MADDEQNPSERSSSPEAAERPLPRERLVQGAVVITGITGSIGRRLTRVLHRERAVIGLDQRSFDDRPKDVVHHALALSSKRARDILRDPAIGAVVHLDVAGSRESPDEHARNVIGFQRLLETVQAFEIPKLVLLSSASVYGPRPDNPQFLPEEAPLLASESVSNLRDLLKLDLFAQSFFWKHPATETAILRPAHVLGPLDNVPSSYFRLEVPPTLLGYDPMIQVVHEEDVVAAVVAALGPGIRGIFNIAGPAPAPLSHALAVLGRTSVPVPYALARYAVDRLFRLGATSFPAPELDFIRYVCMVDDRRARTALGYEPRFDLEATLRAVDDERWI